MISFDDPVIKRMVSAAFLRFGVGIFRAPTTAELMSVIRLYFPRDVPGIEMVRVGARCDGGYVVPDILSEIRECFSPGVDTVAHFELELERRGIACHLLDGSVEKAPVDLTNGTFTRRFLSARTEGSDVTLEDWMSDVGAGNHEDALLQMDIEGSEYACLLATPRDVLRRFKVIVVELHSLTSLADQEFFNMFSEFSKKLTNDHAVVHLHPNNIRGIERIRSVEVHRILEVTLLRSDMFVEQPPRYAEGLRTDLDSPCVPQKPDIGLSSQWMFDKRSRAR